MKIIFKKNSDIARQPWWKTLNLDYYQDASIRNTLFKLKFLLWAAVNYIHYPNPSKNDSSNPFVPGMEVYKALRSATNKNVPIHYMGGVFNEYTMQGLEQEKRLHWYSSLYRSLKIARTYHETEFNDLYNMMSVRGLENMSESIDNKHISVLMYDFEKVNPHQKKILIDKENERLFRHIFQEMEGDTLVAVVNQWHMPAIEYFWRHSTGTEEIGEFINPIGDFDINAQEEARLALDVQQRIMCKHGKTEPMMSRAYVGDYHKFLFEAERSRHVFFEDTTDPHLEHGLFNDENKDVKYLKYDPNAHH